MKTKTAESPSPDRCGRLVFPEPVASPPGLRKDEIVLQTTHSRGKFTEWPNPFTLSMPEEVTPSTEPNPFTVHYNS